MMKVLSDALEKLNIPFTLKQLEQFEEYRRILEENNKLFNLTSITGRDKTQLLHFADSAAVVPLIGKPLEGSDIMDVGTGAGFPGIVLKILVPRINLTLMDSTKKKIDFLRLVSEKLGLGEIGFLHCRAEDAGHDKNHRENYDIVIARAVAPLSVLSEYCIPLVKNGGIFAAMKTMNTPERKEAQNAIGLLGGKTHKTHEYRLPGTDIERSLIIIKKEFTTPAKYPRKAGKPSKTPL